MQSEFCVNENGFSGSAIEKGIEVLPAIAVIIKFLSWGSTEFEAPELTGFCAESDTMIK
jgi:hypothetical protein